MEVKPGWDVLGFSDVTSEVVLSREVQFKQTKTGVRFGLSIIVKFAITNV